MSAIQNLHSFDPFADSSMSDDLLPAGTEDYIHIRIQQRNNRKTLQGVADDYDKKKLVKVFKKKFACNGTIIEHTEYGQENTGSDIIQAWATSQQKLLRQEDA
ncbi:eukaryotic translation initiation factor 1-like [Canis lupus familiaris]|uniref:eukaryotic translation initiation factor 1-like n=1 Tax=Canis lupus familiaris TaxID=9615 RepID=UPI0018F5001D|nr:eukaryotic translation initiation factor 1-like [Canis lupus familiaris]